MGHCCVHFAFVFTLMLPLVTRPLRDGPSHVKMTIGLCAGVVQTTC